MRRSIAELCTADHGGDPKILASWLANKQPQVFRSWLAQGGRSYLVAVAGGAPDGIMLPMLPYYQEYGYDPDKQELVVIEYPAKKKAYQDQQDKALGRK